MMHFYDKLLAIRPQAYAGWKAEALQPRHSYASKIVLVTHSGTRVAEHSRQGSSSAAC